MTNAVHFAPERARITRVSAELRAAVLPRMGDRISGRQLAAEVGWHHGAVERWLGGGTIPADLAKERALRAWIDRHPIQTRR